MCLLSVGRHFCQGAAPQNPQLVFECWLDESDGDRSDREPAAPFRGEIHKTSRSRARVLLATSSHFLIPNVAHPPCFLQHVSSHPEALWHQDRPCVLAYRVGRRGLAVSPRQTCCVQPPCDLDARKRETHATVFQDRLTPSLDSVPISMHAYVK